MTGGVGDKVVRAEIGKHGFHELPVEMGCPDTKPVQLFVVNIFLDGAHSILIDPCRGSSAAHQYDFPAFILFQVGSQLLVQLLQKCRINLVRCYDGTPE
jgi:hypothetical protein